MRSPADMDIIVVDIHNKCHLACSNCTRLIPHQTKKWEMSLEQFALAVRSMEGWHKPGRVLGIIAGEPTLHTQFEELARMFALLWGGPRTTNGRAPIADFNEFTQERLFDRSNGRGLWTSLGKGFYKHYETIMDVFSHFNVNTHESQGRHQALLITREDYCKTTGMSDEEWVRNRDKCWVQNLWSATINDKGAYPCEVMGSIDRLLFEGKHAWKVEKDWWKRTPAEFGDMLELCNDRALAQPGPSQVDSAERDIISSTGRTALAMVNSPAVKKDRFVIFEDMQTHEKRCVNTKDSYVAGARVGPDHTSILPHHISAVVVSVGYGEELYKTIPYLIEAVDEIVVVTSPTDRRTLEVVAHAIEMFGVFDDLNIPMTDGRHSPHIQVVLSDRYQENQDAFNKGKMINDGLAVLTKPDWVILTDADIQLHDNTYNFLRHHALNPGCLYGTERVQTQAWGEDYMDHEPNGFFLLFHPLALAIRERWPRVMSEAFCSAGGVDTWLVQQWPAEKRVMIPEIPVTHIKPSRAAGGAWNGLHTVKGTWRQAGLLSRHGLHLIEAIPEGKPVRIRLTDSLLGERQEAVLDPKTRKIDGALVRSNGRDGLEFAGRDIGWSHVHVAYFLE